jgi:hypothetical protein
MILYLTRTLVGPTVEGIHYALKTLLDRFLLEQTVAKCDVKDAANVIPEALILPEYF